MAFTKLYLRSVAAPYTPATIRGAWDDTAGSVTQMLDSAGGLDTYTLVTRSETNVATEYDVLLYRGVSGALDAQTITGTLNVLIGIAESASTANLHWHLHVYVTQGDSDTPRGTLLSDYRESAGVNEWALESGSDVVGHALNAATALSSLAISAGDRMVVEIGYTARNISTGILTGRLIYGAVHSRPDLTLGLHYSVLSVNAISNGYLVFSNSIAEVSQVGRVSQLGVEALTFEDTIPTRVSQFFVESLTSPSQPARLSQFAVETLCSTTLLPATSTTTGVWMGDVGGTVWIE